MAFVIARFLLPFLMLFLASFVLRALLRYYLRRRFDPPQSEGPHGSSSAKVVDGEYQVKDEPET
jgi:hypothetical protein